LHLGETSIPYQVVTLAQLQTLLAARFDNPTWWSLGEYTTALNEGLSIFQLATGRWRNRFVVTTVPYRTFYDISTLSQLQVANICQVVQPIRVAFNSQPLGWTSFTDMDLAYPGWQAQNTTTPGAPATPQSCGPAGLNLLWIWPADAAGMNALQLDVVTNAPALVNPGDFVNLDQTEIVGLLNYAEHRMSFDRGGIFFARTLPLLQSFYQLLADRNSYLMNLSIFRQMCGSDFARNYSPRRISERSGVPMGVGLR
jgi:hypothetical protein